MVHLLKSGGWVDRDHLGGRVEIVGVSNEERLKSRLGLLLKSHGIVGGLRLRII